MSFSQLLGGFLQHVCFQVIPGWGSDTHCISSEYIGIKDLGRWAVEIWNTFHCIVCIIYIVIYIDRMLLEWCPHPKCSSLTLTLRSLHSFQGKSLITAKSDLVGGFNPLKNMKVSWDDDFQYKHVPVTTNHRHFFPAKSGHLGSLLPTKSPGSWQHRFHFSSLGTWLQRHAPAEDSTPGWWLRKNPFEQYESPLGWWNSRWYMDK